MAFLQSVADWAEKNIPVAGKWIAELVEKIEEAYEGAWGWLKDAVDYVRNVWVPWAERQFNELFFSLSQLWGEIYYYVEPYLDALTDALNEAKATISNIKNTIENLISNFAVMVWEAIPDWFKDAVTSAIDNIYQLWEALTELRDAFLSWVNNAGVWFLEQLNRTKSIITTWVHEVVDATITWLTEKVQELGYKLTAAWNELKNAIERAKAEFSEKIRQLSDFVSEKVNCFEDAISSIDDYLISKLEEFIIALIAWFISTLIHDLTTLRYDPKTKEVEGTPKNPISLIFVRMIEVEKPENPYESVKPRMGVRE